jgi:hypothetical protein
LFDTKNEITKIDQLVKDITIRFFTNTLQDQKLPSMSSSEYLKYAFEKIVLMDDPISKMLILNGFAQNTQNLTLNYLIQYAISFLKDVSDFLKEILLSLTASHAYSTDFNNVMSSVSQYFHALKEKEMQCNQIVYCFASIESLFSMRLLLNQQLKKLNNPKLNLK